MDWCRFGTGLLFCTNWSDNTTVFASLSFSLAWKHVHRPHQATLFENEVVFLPTRALFCLSLVFGLSLADRCSHPFLLHFPSLFLFLHWGFLKARTQEVTSCNVVTREPKNQRKDNDIQWLQLSWLPVICIDWPNAALQMPRKLDVGTREWRHSQLFCF